MTNEVNDCFASFNYYTKHYSADNIKKTYPSKKLNSRKIPRHILTYAGCGIILGKNGTTTFPTYHSENFWFFCLSQKNL